MDKESVERHDPRGLSINIQVLNNKVGFAEVYEAATLAFIPKNASKELVTTNRGEGYRFRAILIANAKLSNGKYFQTIYTRGWLSSVEVADNAREMISESLAELKDGEKLTGKFIYIGPHNEGEEFFKGYFGIDRYDLR